MRRVLADVENGSASERGRRPRRLADSRRRPPPASRSPAPKFDSLELPAPTRTDRPAAWKRAAAFLPASSRTATVIASEKHAAPARKPPGLHALARLKTTLTGRWPWFAPARRHRIASPRREISRAKPASHHPPLGACDRRRAALRVSCSTDWRARPDLQAGHRAFGRRPAWSITAANKTSSSRRFREADRVRPSCRIKGVAEAFLSNDAAVRVARNASRRCVAGRSSPISGAAGAARPRRGERASRRGIAARKPRARKVIGG